MGHRGRRPKHSEAGTSRARRGRIGAGPISCPTDETRGGTSLSEENKSGPAAAAAKKAGRFSKDFLATVISLVTTALGVVVALAWNSAFTGLFARWSPTAKVTALFVYALLITAIGVVAII